jgi:hypothetical protein
VTYTPRTWADGSSGGTPITAADLNNIESGIVNALTTADASVTYAKKLAAPFAVGEARAQASRLGSSVMPTPATITTGSWSGTDYVERSAPVVLSTTTANFPTIHPAKAIPTGLATAQSPTFRVLGTKARVETQQFNPTLVSAINAEAGIAIAQPPWRAVIGHYGTRINFGLAGYGGGGAGQVRFKINGQYVSRTPTTFTNAAWIGLDFTTAAAREIELELSTACGIAFVQYDKTDSVWEAPMARGGPRLYVLGDSFALGSDTTYPDYNGFVQILGERLGCEDLFRDAAGGTGYAKTNGTGTNYQSRVTGNWPIVTAAGGADLALVFGSVNDDASQATVQAAAAAVYATLAPTPVIAVVAPAAYPPSAQILQNLAAVQAAATASSNVLGVLNLTYDLTGPGTIATPNGYGNSDVFRATDGTHWTNAGHAYMASRIAQFIYSLITVR